MIKRCFQHLAPLTVIIHIIVLSILATSCSERQKEKSSTNSHQANEIRGNDEKSDVTSVSPQDEGANTTQQQAAHDDAKPTVEFCGRQWPLSTTVLVCSESPDSPKPLNLGPIAKLTELKKVVLYETSVEDITPLTSLAKLESLNLNHTPVRDIGPLSGLSELRELSLGHTPNILNFQPLQKLTKLTYLNVASNPTLSDPSITVNMRKLGVLIASLTGLEDLPQIPNKNTLKELDLRGTKIQDITELGNLSFLENLNLDETEVVDLKPLVSLKNLKELDISNTQVTDLSPLRDLVSLQSLTVYKTKIEDFEPVSEIKGLKIYGRPE